VELVIRMVKGFVVFLGAFLFFGFQLQAQEIWLQPNKIQYKAGDTLKISFQRGVNFDGRRLNVSKSQVERLELHQASGVQNLASDMIENAKFNVSVPLESEGTKLVVAQTSGNTVKYTAGEFNVFLKDNGLDEVISRRADTNASNNPATESFTTCEKLLVQAGGTKDNSFEKVVGLPLEIIPDKNPLALKKGDVVHFKILFQGKPLFGAKVRIWNYYDHLTTTQNIFTQQDGTIEMIISGAGSWLVNVVKMIPAKDGNAEWQSYRGSLMFGIR